MDLNVFYAIIKTLETVSVRGKEDCDKMAGCIKAIESLAYMAQKEQKKIEAPTESPSAEEGTNG